MKVHSKATRESIKRGKLHHNRRMRRKYGVIRAFLINIGLATGGY